MADLLSDIITALGPSCSIQGEDSLKRRKLLIDIEQYCKDLWAEKNYTVKQTSGFYADLHSALSKCLESSLQFNTDSHWFAGTVPNTSQNSSNSSALSYFASLLIVQDAFCQFNNPSQVFNRTKEVIGSENDFLEGLMENDERLLHTLTALIDLYNKGELQQHSFYHPLDLFLVLLIKLDFSEDIFIDWLSSEPIAIPLVLRYFKAILKEEDFNAIIATVSSFNFKFKVKTETKIPLPQQMTFQINEIHGDTTIEKTFDLKYKTIVKYEDKTKVLSYDEILEKFCGFVTRLLNQLTNLHEKQLLPFNASPLIRTIDMVDDKLME